jgi:hypothetical protein
MLFLKTLNTDPLLFWLFVPGMSDRVRQYKHILELKSVHSSSISIAKQDVASSDLHRSKRKDHILFMNVAGSDMMLGGVRCWKWDKFKCNIKLNDFSSAFL